MPFAYTEQRGEHSIERNSAIVEYLPESDEIRLDVERFDRETIMSVETFREAAEMVQDGETGTVGSVEVGVGGLPTTIRQEGDVHAGVAISGLLRAEGGVEGVLEKIGAR